MGNHGAAAFPMPSSQELTPTNITSDVKVFSEFNGAMAALNGHLAFVVPPTAPFPPTTEDILELVRAAAAASDVGKLAITDLRIAIDHDALDNPELRNSSQMVSIFHQIKEALTANGTGITIPTGGRPFAVVYPNNAGGTQTTSGTPSSGGGGQGLHEHGTGGRYKYEGGAGHPGVWKERVLKRHTIEVGMRFSASDGPGDGVSSFAVRPGNKAPLSVFSLPSGSFWVIDRLMAGEYEAETLADPLAPIGDHRAGLVSHGVPNENVWRATIMIKLEVEEEDNETTTEGEANYECDCVRRGCGRVRGREARLLAPLFCRCTDGGVHKMGPIPISLCTSFLSVLPVHSLAAGTSEASAAGPYTSQSKSSGSQVGRRQAKA